MVDSSGVRDRISYAAVVASAMASRFQSILDRSISS